MLENYPNNNILCIDLKSFFASCECVERNLNPFTTPLVVANPEQGNGAITLAITPYLKNMGIKSRSRIYEIPKHIKFTTAKPRMSLYIKKSKEVISIYLDFVSESDLHVYSIDEVFIDLTNYLKLYKKTDYEMAELILKTIEEKTGLTATCGIGPNMLLAKIAMDTEAKKYKNGIAKWTYDDIETKLWTIKPLSKMWGIGINLEKRLNNLKIYSIGDLAHYDPNILKTKFGVMGLELYNHANGIDLTKISDFKNLTVDKSYSHSQVLFKDYNEFNVKLIINEMINVLVIRLRNNNKVGSVIGLGIGYSKEINGGFYHTMKLDNPTDNSEIISKTCFNIFDSYYENYPVRKVSVSISNLRDKSNLQLNLFENYEKSIIEDNYNKSIDDINAKFGKNTILKASSLLKDSTIIDRNKKIGGHNSE